jgi:hypothetical protein
LNSSSGHIRTVTSDKMINTAGQAKQLQLTIGTLREAALMLIDIPGQLRCGKSRPYRSTRIGSPAPSGKTSGSLP